MVSTAKKLDPPTFVPDAEAPRSFAVTKGTEKDETLLGNDREQSRNGTAWQFAIVFVVGIIMLFATDSLDLKLIQNSGQPTGKDENSHMGQHVVNKHHEFLPGATHVETKEKVKRPDTTTTEGQEVGTENETSESTSEQDNPLVLTTPTHSDEMGTQAEPSETVSGQEQNPSKSENDQAEKSEATKETSTEPAETSKSSAAETPNDVPASKSETDSQPATKAMDLASEVANWRLYRRRGQPLSEADRKAMEDKWGKWTLEDTKERPTTDYFKKYPNRDIPRKDFPSNAWQIDKEYLSKFLPEGLALVERAQEAILAEYGRTQDTYEEREKIFRLELIQDISKEKELGRPRRSDTGGRESVWQGGWMPQASFDSLVRRILHAMMTEDSFVFAMGGHSSAAGHGNHFQQSYTLQVQWILEAVFARLHVRHEARNFGNGGLGTIHNSVAAGSIYGPDVDILSWDAGMTEKEGHAKDLFIRQGLIGGIKVPFIWQGGGATEYFNQAGADFAYTGEVKSELPLCSDVKETEKMAWAVQYVKCTPEMKSICRSKEYAGKCWIDREDFTPNQQNKEPGGRAAWHPGNRIHQKQGRMFTFGILRALKAALTMWNETPNYELPDEAWHIGDYFDNIRSKVPTMGGECFKFPKELHRICKIPLKGRTEFTPRVYPAVTNIRNLMRPEQVKEVGGKPYWPAYKAPDVFNPSLHPPPGAVDVLSIVEAGVDFKPILQPDYTDFYKKSTFSNEKKLSDPIGKGLFLHTLTGDWLCDGTVDSFCDRTRWNQCLLYAHNDYRGGIFLDSLSGWGVMNIPDVKNGFIMVKIESWHQPKENKKTADWKTINNEKRRRRGLEGEEQESNNYNKNNSSSVAELMSPVPDIFAGNYTAEQQRRRNLGKAPPYCKDFRFEFSIDGKVTVENEEQFMKRYYKVQRVVEWVVLLDDPNYTGGKEQEVEIAIRQTGCPHTGRIFSLSHVYWS